ncbi:retron St85 family effector protein [Aeromonas veronii]|uniref:retron St85 family effector protein n=1 Tax=Aeromonas veronii TaxID=654 RepID=UPI003D215167
MAFEATLEKFFGSLEHSKFIVITNPPKIFICGGEFDSGQLIPQSLRERIINHLDDHHQDIYSSCVKAEDFKDYFKEEAYKDLFDFETDIANIATLIIVCLESPGSLVELGMFCSNAHLSHKLCVVAPQDKVEQKNSFIYLGPLESLRSRNKGSVLIYPWPDTSTLDYPHIEFIVSDIIELLGKTSKSEAFKHDNSAHIAFLIHDIILLTYPIKLHEIMLAVKALGLDIPAKTINRLLYLLEKINLIGRTEYSNTVYYYSTSDDERRVKFGTSKAGVVEDMPKVKMSFKQSFIINMDEQSKKRRYALEVIMKIKEGRGK